MTTSDVRQSFQVVGTLRDEFGSPVTTGVAVELYDLRIGGEHPVGRTGVRPDGAYALSFDPDTARSAPDASLDLVVRVVRASDVVDGINAGDTRETIARSATRFAAGPHEELDVVVPAGAAPRIDEHTRVVADIARGLAAAGETGKTPADLVEDEAEGRRDVSFAAAKSGWSARTVAMAALAEREAAETRIPAPLHYALYRAGLPAGPRCWALAPPSVIEAVWSRAVDEGIIAPELTEAMSPSLDIVGDLAEKAVLDLPTGVGDGRLGDLLASTLPDEGARHRFARIYAEQRATPELLWSSVRRDFAPETANRLQLDGALAALTRNNGQLIAKLHDDPAPRRVSDLAASGYHHARTWRRHLTRDVPVPADVPGRDESSRRDAYAALLAEELRLRHPTAVLGAEVAEGAVPVGGPPGTDRAVADFLAEHHERFELAVHSIDEFLTTNDLEVEPPVRGGIATLQRVLAVAPTPEALRGLRNLGFDSARSIAVHGEPAFVARFAPDLGGKEIARETFRRSDQIHSATLATATSHLVARAAPDVYAVPRGGPAMVSGPVALARAAAALADVHTLPNLDTLFGPADTAACEQCESVLSPAAYLVDLLEFLDVDPPSSTFRRPLDVLLERRPDLQHIALSCENTEIALPYVDLANEILEHVVVHKSVDGYTGHDVPPETSSAELLASPQFVDEAAYADLRSASYPLLLPWDQRLAAVRAYLAQDGVTLRDAMAVLAADDANGRSWSDVVREGAGIGPADRILLAGPAVTAQALYGDDPARVTDAQLVTGVGNARRLGRRLGLSPVELVSLLRTRFINPDADLLVLLRRLGVGFPSMLGLHKGTITPEQFKAQLRPGLDTAPFGGDVIAWLAAHHDRIMNIVVLTDPSGAEPPPGDSTGAFNKLELRRTLPDPGANRMRPVDFVAMARFIRVRNSLDWSIERTDDMVSALWPATVSPTASVADVRRNLDTGFDTVLIRLGHLLTGAKLMELDIDKEMPWLLGCFGPLGVRGPESPYRTLFPTSTLLGSDPVFGPGPNGLPPARPDAHLLDHRPALQAALKLTAEELDQIVRAAGVTAQTLLSVDSVSLLFRYGYLARTLQVRVADLVGIIDATGLRPFAPLDGPDPDFLKLVRLARSIGGSGLPVSRLVALTRGADGVTDAAVMTVLRSLRAALVDPQEPAGGQWSESALRALLTTVFSVEVTDAFLSLLAGSSTYTAVYRQAQTELPSPVLARAPGLSYDAARSLLIHRGVLTPEAAAGVTALPNLPAGLAAAVAALANAGQAEYQPLLQANPVLEKRWQVWVATPPDPTDPDGTSKRAALGAALVQDLRPDLRRRQLAEALGPTTGTDPASVAALIQEPVAIPGSAPQRSVGDDLAAITATGLSVRFWVGPAAGPAAGTPARTAIAAAVDYGPGGADLRQAAGIASGAISAIWAAVVDPAVSAAYVLSVEADASAVTLLVDGSAVALQKQGQVWTSAPVTLVAGQPVRLELTALSLGAKARLLWQAPGITQVVLPGSACCPDSLVADFGSSYRRLLVALELATTMGLSVRELLSFARSPLYRIGAVGWLSAVPATALAGRSALVRAVDALAQYRLLRERWQVTGTAIVELLDATVPDQPTVLIAGLAGVTPSVVDDVAAHLGVGAAGGAGLRNLEVLLRVADVLDLTRKVVLPVATLARAVRTTPSTQDVQDLRDAVRARYDDTAWTEVARPVHDQLRRDARDALVARVLQLDNPNPDLSVDEVTGGFLSPDQLFEKLLIDVQMDPVMTTSRIAQAISTVQMFVARVLLNLELQVSPESIDPQRWEAMKQYRVWEANRRVFLFPENWLDPELRDDKSPFFRDVESELLQTDITDQAAATALGHYLEKLDDVANLEIAGLHVAEHTTASGILDPIVRVIGRTSGAKRSYFHRILDGTWRAWEPVDVEVQDDPVLPVIWKGRFLLFWLKVSKQPDSRQPGPFGPSAQPGTPLGDLTMGDLNLKATAAMTVSLFWSEYYNGRWQSPRTSDPDRPIDLGAKFTVIGDPLSLRLASDIQGDSAGGRDSLGIIVLNPSEGGTGNSYFRLYTTHSLPVRQKEDNGPAFGFPVDRAFSERGPFVVTIRGDELNEMRVLNASQSPYRAVGPMHRLKDPQHAPFFFQDSRHVFYVHPDPKDLLPTTGPVFGVFPEPIGAPPTFLDPDMLVIDLVPIR